MLLGQLSDVNCRSPICVNQKLDITCAPDRSRGVFLDVLHIDCEWLDIIQCSVTEHKHDTPPAAALFSATFAFEVPVTLFQMKPTRFTPLLSIFISTSLHVSGNYVPITRRTYGIYATLVIFTLYGNLYAPGNRS